MKDKILLEIMIVILIMGILTAIALPQMQKYRERRKQLLNKEIIAQEQEQINNKIENAESMKTLNKTGDE